MVEASRPANNPAGRDVVGHGQGIAPDVPPALAQQTRSPPGDLGPGIDDASVGRSPARIERSGPSRVARLTGPAWETKPDRHGNVTILSNT